MRWDRISVLIDTMKDDLEKQGYARSGLCLVYTCLTHLQVFSPQRHTTHTGQVSEGHCAYQLHG